ncbi:tRNA glutamyl-Q(34) synthetase GluQRS [Parasphingorhabdus cellanae]|uniref:tRNA glutamyl-Q(34) synthetase GluQRS n=1 Tax=Parasphingorhabdus cellanae TaxID=2806553 RepID=A0ABX7T3G0_9SPHN|nr:tRNA glutamyl-Q(34) synthetase GluQRS [Parasphingorhabdus cellanae]QTD55342.1 tRNA glutamyl-Q(34) synthetase GluQRS [Parasphingorhabdus cellanae]
MTSRGDVGQYVVVRFAPSPNGLLHLGHAYAACVVHDYARERGGKLMLRIEDIDSERSKPEFVDAILADLRWLGLDWDGKVIFQSDRLDSYAETATRLKNEGLLYPCFCTRSSMRAVQEMEALEEGPDGPIYPGTCRNLHAGEAAERMENEPHSWRLDVAKAISLVGDLSWHDERHGDQIADPTALGDVVLIPKDTPVSYHLAVTLDDARDGITHVVRGEDLFASTHIHRLLQALLDLPVPCYVHHPVLLDETGVKLSKSRDSASLAVLREAGERGYFVADKLRENIFPVGIMLSKG